MTQTPDTDPSSSDDLGPSPSLAPEPAPAAPAAPAAPELRPGDVVRVAGSTLGIVVRADSAYGVAEYLAPDGRVELADFSEVSVADGLGNVLEMVQLMARTKPIIAGLADVIRQWPAR